MTQYPPGPQSPTGGDAPDTTSSTDRTTTKNTTTQGGSNAIPSEELEAALRDLADELGRVPKAQEMDRHGRHWYHTYRCRYGTWDNALEAAGVLDDYPDQRYNGNYPRISEEKLRADLERVIDLVDGRPSIDDYREHGKYSIHPIRREFGSWGAALEEYGFPARLRGEHHPAWTDDEELIDDLQAGALFLGRPPLQEEVDKFGEHSHVTYKKHFGSWEGALRAAGLIDEEGNEVSTDELLEMLGLDDVVEMDDADAAPPEAESASD